MDGIRPEFLPRNRVREEEMGKCQMIEAHKGKTLNFLLDMVKSSLLCLLLSMRVLITQDERREVE